MSEITRILSKIEQGDASASEQLLPLVYDELRKLAAARLVREKPGQTLQATALVHEAYLRLVAAEEVQKWDSRGHFFAAAAEAIRRILIENARRKRSTKYGGNMRRVELSEEDMTGGDQPDRLVVMDEVLTRFEKIEPVKAKLVKLRFFVGMTNLEAAKLMGISATTADRYWAYARAWMKREIDATGDSAMG